MKIETVDFKIRGDERGALVAINQLTDVPFEIRRVYYMWNTLPDVERGFHAHQALEQVLICVSGSCTVTLDDGRERRDVLLDRPDRGLYIGPGYWREMRGFSGGAVLMVLASQTYNPADYIRDYGEFLASVGATKEE